MIVLVCLLSILAVLVAAPPAYQAVSVDHDLSPFVSTLAKGVIVSTSGLIVFLALGLIYLSRVGVF